MSYGFRSNPEGQCRAGGKLMRCGFIKFHRQFLRRFANLTVKQLEQVDADIVEAAQLKLNRFTQFKLVAGVNKIRIVGGSSGSTRCGAARGPAGCHRAGRSAVDRTGSTPQAAAAAAQTGWSPRGDGRFSAAFSSPPATANTTSAGCSRVSIVQRIELPRTSTVHRPFSLVAARTPESETSM